MDTRSVTDAVLTRLQAVITTGDATNPDYDKTSQGLPVNPYAVLYALPDIEFGGSLSNERQWAFRHFQVTVVGGTRGQTETGQQTVRDQLSGWVPTVSGVVCGPVELDDPAGVDRDDDVEPPLFFSTDRFRLYVS